MKPGKEEDMSFIVWLWILVGSAGAVLYLLRME
jgi:hypothetical protein